MAEEKRVRGAVVFFNAARGFGFIRPHGDDEDLFVHKTEVQVEPDGYRTLYQDQEVEFDIVLDLGTSKKKACFITPPGGGTFDSRSRRRSGNGRRSNGNDCYNCGGVGHMARDCPSPSQPRLFDGGDRACRNCGQQGHFAKECSRGGGRGIGGGGRNCYACGDVGHVARDCSRGGDGGVGGGGRGCFTCGDPEHKARECPSGGGEGKKQESRKCFRCQKTGHIKIDCKEEALVVA